MFCRSRACATVRVCTPSSHKKVEFTPIKSPTSTVALQPACSSLTSGVRYQCVCGEGNYVKRFVLIGLWALAGCTGVDGEKYLGRPGSPAWFATASPNTQASYFRDRCATYGFKPGTVEMAQCIQAEAGSSRQTAAFRSAMASQATATDARSRGYLKRRHFQRGPLQSMEPALTFPGRRRLRAFVRRSSQENALFAKGRLCLLSPVFVCCLPLGLVSV